jgi:hypothetical protein
MKRTVHCFAHPSRLVVVMVAFLAAICFINTNLVLAASGPKKPATAADASHVDRTEIRIQELHATLKITEGQEELWSALIQVMRENAKTMDNLAQARAEKSKTMNAVEDLKSYSGISDAYAEGLKRFIPPFEALYAAMSDDQKKNADTIFRHGEHGKAKRK